MPKVTPVKKTLSQILKKRNLKMQKPKAPAQLPVQTPAATPVKDTNFDNFLKQTARDMIKEFTGPRFDLKVANHSNSYNRIYSQPMTDSIWAFWSNMAKRKN